MSVKYEYTKSPVDLGRLGEEILAESGITTAYLYSNFRGPNSLDIYFASALSGAEETLIDNIVTNHTGEAIPDPAELPTGDLEEGLIISSDGVGSTVWGNLIDLLSAYEWETSSEGLSTTTSIEWQEKTSLTLSGVEAGKYRINFFYEWAFDTGSFEFWSRVQIDDTDIYMQQEVRPSPANTNKFRASDGFVYVALTSGTHYIDLDYCSSKVGQTAAIRRSRLSARRVS